MEGEVAWGAKVEVDLVEGSGHALCFYAADCAHDVAGCLT